MNGEKFTESTVVAGDTTYYAHFTRVVKYTNCGGCAIENGIASDFGEERYVKSIDEFDFSMDFDITLVVNVGENANAMQQAFGVAKGMDFEFGVFNGRFLWEVSGRKWSKDDEKSTWPIGNVVVSPGRTYWLKVVKRGKIVQCFVSEDGESWTRDFQTTREID